MSSGLEPDFFLIPVEALAPGEVRSPWRERLVDRGVVTAAALDLLAEGLERWADRVDDLARRAPGGWDPPRWRSVVVLREPWIARPWVPLLNLGAWTLHGADLETGRSHPEFVAYLLANQDRQARLREVSFAAVHDAAWWFARDDAEIEAFRAAAERSTRPDAEAFRLLAAAIPWLRTLGHEALRPVDRPASHRAVPGTGLLVPRAIEDRPPSLVAGWARVAGEVLQEFHRTHAGNPAPAVRALGDWLAGDAPPLLVCAGKQRIVWDPARPEHLGALRSALRAAGPAAVVSVHRDLAVIAARTRSFLGALVDPDVLPSPADTATRPDQSGYSYLHAERRLVAYDLEEPGIERLRGPAIPFAREMIAARTVHEWAHLAVDAGLVPRVLDDAAWSAACEDLAGALAETIRTAPPGLRRAAQRDVFELAELERSARRPPDASSPRGGPALGDERAPGEPPADPFAGAPPGDETDAASRRMVRILLGRLPDWQANLLARRVLAPLELEIYVRHNVRPLRPETPPWALWRRLARHLHEMRYLELLAIEGSESRVALYARASDLSGDRLAGEALDPARLEMLAGAARRLYAAFRIDEARWR